MYTFKHFFNYNGFILSNLGFMPLVHAFKKKSSHSQETKYGDLYFKEPTLEFKVTLGSSLVTVPRAQSNRETRTAHSFHHSLCTSNEDRSTSDERVVGLNRTEHKTKQ